MNTIITQGIGAIAFILLGLSYYKKEKKEILYMQIFSSIAFSIHYFLLNGITGAVCNLISMLMMVIIYIYDQTKRNNKKILILIMIPVLILIALLSWENVFSIFPIISSTLMLIAFLHDKPNDIRAMGVVSNLSWTIYGIMLRSYITIAFETIILLASIVALLKNDKN